MPFAEFEALCRMGALPYEALVSNPRHLLLWLTEAARSAHHLVHYAANHAPIYDAVYSALRAALLQTHYRPRVRMVSWTQHGVEVRDVLTVKGGDAVAEVCLQQEPYARRVMLFNAGIVHDLRWDRVTCEEHGDELWLR